MSQKEQDAKIIHSLSELPVARQKQVLLVSRSLGILSVLITLITFPIWGEFPAKNSPLLVFCTDWIFIIAIIAIPIATYAYGAILGYQTMLATLVYRYLEDSSFPTNHPSSTNDSPIHRANDYSSFVSINPSSSLPMAGNSGMDISGNPYGSRSW